MQSDLKALEFDAVRRLLEKLTSTPYGADAARHIEPAPGLGVARAMLAAVTAARAAMDAGELPSLRDVPDIRAALRQASYPGAALPATALRNLRQVITAAGGLRPAVAARPALYPGPKDHLDPPPQIMQRLDRTILASGRVREDASPRLVELAGQLRTLRQEVVDALAARIQHPDLEGAVSADKIVWQGGRAMLAVAPGQAERIRGVRRGTAGSRGDQLIEPMEVIAQNNRVEALVGQQEVETQALLRELTGFLRDHLAALGSLLDALTWVDLALAAGKLSAQFNAHAPQLADVPRIHLDRAYHPALLLQFAGGQGPRPMPLSLTIDAHQPMLIVTGPNTGGKTVALKTVGLLVTMAHCGLHIPADGDCVIGNFSRVLVDIGDPQSLYHHLSTFAGHVEALKRILRESDSGTLVLLDELGTGTDPEEGAALAMAVLDELVAKKVQGIVTTHLAPLKAFAAHHDGLTNASMVFDEQRLQPTFELQVGTTGRSLGLVIARKNGLPEEVVERARTYLRDMVASQDRTPDS
ncbi:MAG: endonuclease MutS2 [Acidiferrobacterales bacterium]